MKWLLLASLTVVAGLAAVATAQKTKPSGRAELALTTCILWQAILGFPIYALGVTNHLTAPALAFASGAFSLAVLAVVAWRGSWLGSALEVADGVVALVNLPFDGLARAARARSLVLLPLLLAAFLIAYTAFASYFTPSWRQWDSLWYHETIVGLTLQNHGFAFTYLGDDTQKANAYPRFCEMMQLWFVIFTDRRLIDVVGSLVAPGLMLGIYLIARRYTRDVVVCMGWAAVVMVVPTPYYFQITYIDLQLAVFLLAGTYYATRPAYRLVDAWLAALCVTLAIGSKYLALPPAGIILLIALARLLEHHGLRGKSLATLVGGGTLVLSMVLCVYLRNWLLFKNPMWPDLNYENAAHKIHIAGVAAAEDPFNLNMKLSDLLEVLFSVPYSVGGLGRRGDAYYFGFPFAWIILPLSGLSLLVAFFRWGRDVLGRVLRVPGWLSPDAANPLLVALPIAVSIVLCPVLWQGRYNIASVGGLAALVAYLGGRPRWHAFGHGAVAAASVASIIAFVWLKPRWIWLPSELAKLAAIPYPEREVTPAAEISKAIDFHSGSAITKEAGLEREKMKPGEVFAWDYIQFPALLWNNSFTNKVIYVAGGPGYFERINAIGARLALCQNGLAHCTELIAATTGPNPTWKDVGVLNVENWSHVYRRLTP